MNKSTIIAVCGIVFGSFITAFAIVGFMSERGFGTGSGFWYDVGSLWFLVLFVCGLPYSVYLAYRYEQKKKQVG